ncbi:MAG: VanW family protein [Intestinibacter sp.]|uniref:VanW family protein n=1 Tax=Intestinibacter sp. TaxID=1965304 RepID=UPI003F1517A0
MLFKNKNFCELHPICYSISVKKEIFKRYLKDFLSKEKFASTIENEKLSNIVSSHSSNIIKRGKGIDITLQKNKEVNIMLACKKINGMIIRPGETFSFWKTVGPATSKNGYKDGRVIVNNELKAGTGGGLCNLGNTINLLILHSPLEITELHKHSDALAPDQGKRVPFSSGTSISYNYIDYRFKNNTEQNVQLLVWCQDGKLYGELRSEKEFPWSYELVEENHHFEKKDDKYYRVSKIYKNTTEKSTGKILDKELIWDNRSKVMFDYDLIPKDQITV